MGGHGSLEESRRLIEEVLGYGRDCVHYRKGWFQETLPEVVPEMGRIALLRLDGDWYASVKTCLDALYEKVVAGGFVVVDDYGFYEGCTRAVDEFLKRNGIRVYLNEVDGGCIYFVKP